jgi:hypothetical protein
MRLRRPVVWGVTGAVLVLAACGGDTSSGAAVVAPAAPTVASTIRPPVVVTSTVFAPTLPQTSRTVVPSPSVPAASDDGPLMPDVVCLDLQLAQDTIQSAGVFFSKSRDATGEGRRQILDRNWIVVAQTPPPGTPFGEGDAVLDVVKDDEPNDC